MILLHPRQCLLPILISPPGEHRRPSERSSLYLIAFGQDGGWNLPVFRSKGSPPPLPDWIEDEAKALLVIYAMCHTLFAVAAAVLTLCFAYLGLFQKPPKRYLKLNITQIVLAIILLGVSLPVAWLVLSLLSGGLVG